MLEEVSWKDFLIVGSGGVAAYYGLLLVAGKLRLPITRDKPPTALPLSLEMEKVQPELLLSTKKAPDAPVPEAREDDSEFAALELLAEEVQVIITQFGTNGGTKELLLLQLRKEVSRYPYLNKPAFQQAINNMIIKAAAEECQLIITAEEASVCWPE